MSTSKDYFFTQAKDSECSERNIYNQKFYHQPGPKHLKSLITQLAKELEIKNILDVGAGSGWLVNHLQKQGFGVIGIDYSPMATKKNLVLSAKATKLPFADNQFDLVTAVSLIEHLNSSDVKRFLNEVKRVLKPTGYLFLITPNLASPVRLIQGKKWHGFCDSTHIKFFTPWSLKNLLKKGGFTNFRLTFPSPPAKDFDWTVPKILKNSPKPIRKMLNFLVISTPLALIKNSFAILAQSTKKQ